MKKQQFRNGLIIMLLAVIVFSCTKSSSPQPAQNTGGSSTISTTGTGKTTGTTSVYLTNAQQTHAFVTGNILTTYSSYRVNTTTNTGQAFEWYNTSQIYADAAGVQSGDATYASYMNNDYNWMGHMWDISDPNGGYFAAANIDGSGQGGGRYVDDNSLTGVAYLDAYNVTTGTQQAAYLASAEACANWLINSGQWDNTFGGGFWWNTDKQLKPTQSNGLAMQLFLRLYQITGQSVYATWANNVKGWLEGTMFDSASGLYIWEITGTGAGTRQTAEFTYDNAIMIEADLLYAKAMNDNTYIGKAEALATALHTKLWSPTYNVFLFNTTDPRLNPAWCGWASQSLIRLYEADANATWLTYAQQNIDGINKVLRDPVSHGYYQFAGPDGSGKYTNLEGVDQAWMQRIQLLLSKYK